LSVKKIVWVCASNQKEGIRIAPIPVVFKSGRRAVVLRSSSGDDAMRRPSITNATTNDAAQIVTQREELKAALAKAEAALAEAVVSSTQADLHPAETNASLDKARAYCRQAHAALVELDRSESSAVPGEGVDTLIRHLEEVSDGAATASVPPSMPATGGEYAGSQYEFGPKKPVRRIDTAIARSPLTRQTINLLALTLAYLQYYYFDVQLQIMSLPSVTTFPIQ
jgi:hypothetical protein